MGEESVVTHYYNFGDHRCKRGHSYRIKFEVNSQGLTSGYIKVCRRCGKDEVRVLSVHGNKVVSSSLGVQGSDELTRKPDVENADSHVPDAELEKKEPENGS